MPWCARTGPVLEHHGMFTSVQSTSSTAPLTQRLNRKRLHQPTPHPGCPWPAESRMWLAAIDPEDGLALWGNRSSPVPPEITRDMWMDVQHQWRTHRVPWDSLSKFKTGDLPICEDQKEYVIKNYNNVEKISHNGFPCLSSVICYT